MKHSVFVRIDKYREVHDAVSQIRTKVEEAKSLLGKIRELKNQEDAELSNWQKELNTVEQKLESIGQSLSEH